MADYSEEHRVDKQKMYTAKTKVCRRTIYPVWDEEFRFDVSSDTLLQDVPMIFKVWAAVGMGMECIGLVYVDLNPLLTQTAREDYDDGGGGIIDGWFPLYDTLGGVRGELGLSVKLNFIGDVNPFRDSSAGVQLFPFSTLDAASGYTVVHVFGFVEELVVAEDPEFVWDADFRKAKTSHETRQTLMYLLDASVRRRMCKKVLEVSSAGDSKAFTVFGELDLSYLHCFFLQLGGNAVLGYHQVSHVVLSLSVVPLQSAVLNLRVT